MLFLFAAWISLAFSCSAVGAALMALARCGEEIPDGVHRRVFQCGTGLLALPSLILPASFLAPLGPWWALAVYGALPAALMAHPAVRAELRRGRLSRWEWGAGLLILAACAWASSGIVALYDTGLYHYPLIQWLANYGTVPGQAMMHHRFGFSSTWLSPAASFDHGWLQGRTVALLNGLVYTLTCFHFAYAGARILRGARTKLDAYFAGAYPLMLLYGNIHQHFHVSPSPNYAVAWAVVLVGGALMVARQRGPESSNLPLLVGAAAFAVKLSGVAALAAGGLLRAGRGPWSAAILPVLAVAALIAFPAPYANYAASGCPLYPASLFCVSSPTSLPPANVRAVERETLYWARYSGFYPRNARFFQFDWLGRWISWPLHAAFVAITGLCLLLPLLLRAWNAAAWMGLAGAVYVMLSAPDLRFAFGYTAVLAGVAAAAVLPRIRLAFPRAGAGLVLGLLAAAGSALVLKNSLIHEDVYRVAMGLRDTQSKARRLLRPHRIRWSVEAEGIARQGRVNDISYHMPPRSDQCWGLAAPCVPYPVAEYVSPDVRLCDPKRGLRGGVCLSR